MSASDSLPTEVTNQFTVHNKLGSGSYGEVWLAESTEFGLFALKIIDRSSFADNRPFDRELRGLQYFVPVSKKDHGHLKIYFAKAAANNEFLYYGMELADNTDETPPSIQKHYTPRTLKETLISERPLSPKTIHNYVKIIAQALSHLHQNNLIHRDIKPSNIIFVNGRPKLADIGLVTTLDITFTSDLGTRGYMPPDEKSSPLSDIYSLGRVLYEMLFRLPVTDYPRIPEQTLSHPDSRPILELNEIVIRCCQPDPKKRYKNVTELLRDLELLEAGRSLRRINKNKIRNHKLLRATPIALLTTILVSSASSTFYIRNRNNANTELQTLKERIEERVHNHWTGQHFQSLQELETFSKRRPSKRHQPTLNALNELVQNLPDITYDAGSEISLTKPIQSLTRPLHPKTPLLVGHTHNNQPILVDLNERRSWIPPSSSNDILTASWLNPQLNTLFTARRTDLGTTTLFRQPIDGSLPPEIVLNDSDWFLTGVSIPSEANTQLITTPAGATFKIQNGRAEPKNSIFPSSSGHVHFTPEHTRLHPTEPQYALWSSSFQDVRVIDLEHWEISHHQFHHDAPVEDLAWCSIGPIFATVTTDSTIYLWDANTGEQLIQAKNPHPSANQITFTADPTILITSSPTQGSAIHRVDNDASLTTLLLANSIKPTHTALAPHTTSVLSVNKKHLSTWAISNLRTREFNFIQSNNGTYIQIQGTRNGNFWPRTSVVAAYTHRNPKNLYTIATKSSLRTSQATIDQDLKLAILPPPLLTRPYIGTPVNFQPFTNSGIISYRNDRNQTVTAEPPNYDSQIYLDHPTGQRLDYPPTPIAHSYRERGEGRADHRKHDENIHSSFDQQKHSSTNPTQTSAIFEDRKIIERGNGFIGQNHIQNYLELPTLHSSPGEKDSPEKVLETEIEDTAAILNYNETSAHLNVHMALLHTISGGLTRARDHARTALSREIFINTESNDIPVVTHLAGRLGLRTPSNPPLTPNRPTPIMSLYVDYLSILEKSKTTTALTLYRSFQPRLGDHINDQRRLGFFSLHIPFYSLLQSRLAQIAALDRRTQLIHIADSIDAYRNILKHSSLSFLSTEYYRHCRLILNPIEGPPDYLSGLYELP